MSEDDPFALPVFEPGQVVRHRRYGYRGLIVDFDMRCQAPDSWYLANRTKPNRDQPWYHVLVDGTDRVTYAAEENLGIAPWPQPIKHPGVGQWFECCPDGQYRRNDEPWPGFKRKDF